MAWWLARRHRTSQVVFYLLELGKVSQNQNVNSLLIKFQGDVLYKMKHALL